MCLKSGGDPCVEERKIFEGLEMWENCEKVIFEMNEL
jgi:hypothetical protein